MFCFDDYLIILVVVVGIHDMSTLLLTVMSARDLNHGYPSPNHEIGPPGKPFHLSTDDDRIVAIATHCIVFNSRFANELFVLRHAPRSTLGGPALEPLQLASTWF